MTPAESLNAFASGGGAARLMLASVGGPRVLFKCYRMKCALTKPPQGSGTSKFYLSGGPTFLRHLLLSQQRGEGQPARGRFPSRKTHAEICPGERGCHSFASNIVHSMD